MRRIRQKRPKLAGARYGSVGRIDLELDHGNFMSIIEGSLNFSLFHCLSLLKHDLDMIGTLWRVIPDSLGKVSLRGFRPFLQVWPVVGFLFSREFRPNLTVWLIT